MKIRLFTLYNQWLEYFTRNACSIYVLFHIIQVQWWIVFTNDFIVNTAEQAQEDKVWYEAWWTYYERIFDWFILQVNIFYNIAVNIKTYKSDSEKFEYLLRNWYAFWIWLKYAATFYKNIRADQIITMEEMQKDMSDSLIMWHALTYFYSEVTSKFYILDSLNSSRKPIEMSLEVFKEGVKNDIFFTNSRTIILEDLELDHYLRFFRTWGRIENMDLLPPKERKAADLALKLRIKK